MGTDVVRSRAGRIVGRRGAETRSRLLGALFKDIESGHGWRQVSVPRIADAAGSSPATFYQYFRVVEHAVFEIARDRLDGSGVFPPRLAAVVGLLAVEGWAEAKRLQALIAERVEEMAGGTAGLADAAVPAEPGPAPQVGDRVVLRMPEAAFLDGRHGRVAEVRDAGAAQCEPRLYGVEVDGRLGVIYLSGGQVEAIGAVEDAVLSEEGAA